MAEAVTVARPYAQALFQLAQEKTQLAAWGDKLNSLVEVTNDPQVATLIKNPNVQHANVIQVVFALVEQDTASLNGAKPLDADIKNFMSLLADNGRLTLLPDIAVIYGQLRAEAEKVTHAEVIAAIKVSKVQQTQIALALKARLGCKVELTCRVDESLLGGAIIRAGDLVIDGSVIAKLEKLERELIH